MDTTLTTLLSSLPYEERGPYITRLAAELKGDLPALMELRWTLYHYSDRLADELDDTANTPGSGYGKAWIAYQRSKKGH